MILRSVGVWLGRFEFHPRSSSAQVATSASMSQCAPAAPPPVPLVDFVIQMSGMIARKMIAEI